uniref:cytochrome-c oxidase n=1 Tax=Thelazia callipaeda TaxID=103827 RepID=A0A1E1GIZ6_THECL|nr:cytochrome c oxidase subunit II [Thelazia callipaeda]
MMYFSGLGFPLSGSSLAFCCHYVHNYYGHIIFLGFFSMLILSFFIFLGSHTYKFSLKYSDSRMVETFLQFLVINFLVLMAGPGFWLVQYQGRVYQQPELSLKVTGHQWYWNYEYGDSEELSFDSFMKPLEDLRAGEFRLLEVDNRCVLPAGVSVGVYCTSGDVIHSFCLPKCFIKMDALSGLLTKITLNFSLLGLFYGQCSEICGANHSFMPIVLEVTSLECWAGWCLKFFS